MNPGDLETYLHQHIPLSKAMQVSVSDVSVEAVVLTAPLAPNINHRDTVFGGSACAVAILSAWSLLHLRLAGVGMNAKLVIQQNTMNYDLPIFGTFAARATLADPDAWPRFLRMLGRKGRARISAGSVLAYDGRIAGRFSGEFVALGTAGV